MFRAQSSPMDDAIVKATDENLTSENWEYILDVCDRVSANPSGAAQATAALIKRLAHRNANVQLYTLELANALSQNCGLPLHRELASKAFTDALLRLAADRTTHAQVKQKVLERMGSWSDEFRSSPELGIMEQAYQKLRTQQPGLMPPSKPTKKEISSDDRRKEDEELQMALALSIKDKGPVNGTTQSNDSKEQQVQNTQSQQPTQQGTTAATVSRVRALYDFTPSEPGELAFRKNDIIAVLESVYKDWWKGSLRGQTGIFPLNYVEKLQDPTKEELERDAQMEAEVFGEIKNVEKLLALLSVGSEGGGRRGEREEEEISELYQRTLSIRPKLIELIARYSQKKDDFTQLNEKFIKARRDYEALLESSMSQPPQHQQYPIRSRPPPQFQHQQPPYGAPQHQPQGYPQGHPQNAQQPAQPFSPSQQHLPPQQDPQRYYSPAPAERTTAQQPGFTSPYPPQNAPPPNAAASVPAPFHFIPGGVQSPPPNEVRRKPSPNAAPGGPYDAYNAPQGFQGQIRPNSIHTLNSGNPQELATGGYESPIDNRHSYPSAQMGQPVQPPAQTYNAYPTPQQPYHSGQAPPAQANVSRDDLSRQRTHSFENPPAFADGQMPQQQQQQQQQHPAGPGGPSSPGVAQYQAYQPQPSVPSGGGGGKEADPGDFYR
ncbi:Class E vacuolar protein-sorting machinery protein hse1 [Cercospora beticola]|uniref:Class E vacuolar protein-sorting machinery protein HSE1 n=1 Tax=Cercospora beticola TaxID=122368 RepID=A0A2G5I6S4_CERBT|nr:Class E vacuolar protein-sorting machinery protein hse1 [Cercospora beticola]PIB00490.1 Class E vacuolar protein-sorting machinery protein hse1 [Cercospora beticola]WPA96794.1 hypothetical protein RHO25_001402 [Cercospora beticola]CAK1354838.1 unnamed protein product [Cercospora beticola]